MESLRRLMSRKENYPWEMILMEWEHLVRSSVAREDGNPWKEWCRSWEMYEKCHLKPPKSGKKMEAVLRELYYIAKKTADKLDEATGMRQQLKSQNVELLYLQQEVSSMDQQLKNQYAELKKIQEENLLLKKKCESLQNKLTYEQNQKIVEDSSMDQQLKNQYAELKKLQEENLLLKKKCESLQNKLTSEQNQKIVEDYHHIQELEKEVNQRQSAEKEIKRLRSCLLEDWTEIEKLTDEISALKGELVPLKEEQEVNVKYILNQYYEKLIINYPTQKQLAIQGIEGKESWYYMARRAGVGCPSRYKIWKRLEKYEDPRLTVDNAPYWILVVQLSGYEDLGTGEPR